MINSRRAKRIGLLAVPAILAASVMLHYSGRAQQTPAAPAPAIAGDTSLVYNYADQISHLVQNGKIDELSHLNIPSTTSQTVKLHNWTTSYATEMQNQEKQREKQYNDAVQKAQDALKEKHFDQAMESVVLAYRIAKDPSAFLELPWVKDLTAQVSARAAELEKEGRWIESLQRYSDLNTLYEVSTRYKADMQRLARRTALLAVYTPRTLYDMRKKVLDAERAAAATQPGATPAATDDQDDAPPDPSSFTRWQDYVKGATVDMMRKSIDDSANDWVEQTSYDTLVKGGIDALRLFLTTPELAKEFPALGDAAARKKFSDALDGSLAIGAGHPLVSEDVDKIVTGLIQVSDDSVKLPKEVIIMEFTNGAMEKLDPFTAVIWPHEVPEFEKNMQGKFGGIGIQISLEKDPTNIDKIAIKNEIQKLQGPGPVEVPPALDKNDKTSAKVGSSYKLVVITPLENTPAFKAGIKAGDIITAIDGKSTDGISMDQAVSSIMGIPGTDLTLQVKRGQQAPKDFKLKRDIIKVASVKGVTRDAKDSTKWDFMLDQDNKIGYISITGFQEDTPDDLQAALNSLKDQGMRGLVIDLRFNPGGLLQAAVDMCDMFLQDGVIVSTKGRSSRAKEQAWRAHAATEIPANMPMIVLVNEYSASASEIFSGAMKDLHRALIVGHRSFGKGSVQNLLNIGKDTRPDGMPDAMMKLTMAYYYLPNGESLHRRDGHTTWGVDPDVAVDLTPDQLNGLLKERRDADIIHSADDAPVAAPTTTQPAPGPDTQLETALLMMRLQLVQAHS